MSDVALSSPVTAAYLAALEATGRPIGDAKKPPGQTNLYPYGILYTGVVRAEGTLVEPNETGLHRLQLTVVGLTREGVDDLRDLARPILLDRDIVIDGYAVVWAELLPSPAIDRDDDVKPPVFSAAEIVNVLVTPILGS